MWKGEGGRRGLESGRRNISTESDGGWDIESESLNLREKMYLQGVMAMGT